MRVLYLLPSADRPDRIGAFTFLDEEVEGLCAAGIEGYVVSTAVDSAVSRGRLRLLPVPQESRLPDRFRTVAFLIRQRRLISRAWIRSPLLAYHAVRIERYVAELIEEHRIDLVHSHFGWPNGFGGMLAAAQTGVPLVATMRGMDLLLDPSIGYGLRRNREYDRTVRRLLAKADYTTYASDFMRRTGESLGADPSRTVVITKGVDTDRFTVSPDRARLRDELGLGETGPVIFSVATRLGRRKGIDDTLHALARIRETHEFSFIVCGDSPRRTYLEELADELSLSDRVRFIGRVSRQSITQYFAACDVFVLASLVEAAGNVVLEAMASGRPVICTDSGGPPEYVQHGETGFVVPVGNPVVLADRIRLLLDDSELREALGSEGRRVAEEHLRYGQLVESYLDVYREALGRKTKYISQAEMQPSGFSHGG